MKVAIRYYTKTGNTKKLAEGLSSAINVEALSVDHPLSEDVDILFLGSSVYGAGVDNEVKKFIENINVNVGKIVNFSTAALIESTYKQVKKIAEENNITMAEEEFHCRGSFKLVHRGRPNDEDVNDLVKFAEKILSP